MIVCLAKGMSRVCLVAAVLLSAAAGTQAAEGPVAAENAAALQERIAKLIAGLGDPNYAVRQRAQDELSKIGFDAFDALTAAANHEDLEIATRARYLLRLIQVQWTTDDDPPEVRAMLDQYESQSGDVKLERIQRLAKLPGGMGVPALCRLIRCEKSLVLTKRAALAIIAQPVNDPARRTHTAAAVGEHLGICGRPAANWLRTYVQLWEDPKAALPEWSKLVGEEVSLFARSPGQSAPEVVTLLLYRLAEAQAARGDAAAEKTAERARAISAGNDPTMLLFRLETSHTLAGWGLFAWAEQELRIIIDSGVPEFAYFAHSRLAEMWHDQGKDLPAADLLDAYFAKADPETLKALATYGLEPEELRARMHYFRACHAEQQGDRAKQREWLDKAVETYPAEIDTLIARFRLPDAADEYRRKTSELIRAAAADLRRRIDEEGNEERLANYLNQWAWLVGSTEGDIDEAIGFCQKALQTTPDSGPVHDTLARCHFTKGDHEAAVKYQLRAAELEPHSGLIAKQHALFRKTLAEKQGAKPADR